MVRYTPPSRRRRRIVVAAVVGLLVGLVAGVLLGRAATTTAAEQLAHVRREGTDLATRVQALTIEYDQAVAAQGDTIQAGVLVPLAGITTSADRVMADADWLGADDRAAVDDALAAVRQGATARVTAAEFARLTDAAATSIRRQLGVQDGG